MKILIATGGTGGHIYPAITLANELKTLKHSVVFVGSKNRMEHILIPEKGFEFIGLNIKRNGPIIIRNLIYIFSLINAFFISLKIVDNYDVVVGFGNYISVPVILAAKFKAKKILLHEQNSIPGKANLFLARFADTVLCSFESSMKYFSSKNVFYSGNPQASLIKSDFDKNYYNSFGLNPNKKTVVFFFGSLGSMTMDKIMKEFLQDFNEDYQVIYATGSNYIQDYNLYSNPKVRVVEKVDGLKALNICDLLVSRSGATTLSEIAALSVAAILIPSPYVSNNHQYHNAKMLSDINAAILLEEKELNSDVLKQNISEILNNDVKLNELKENVIKFAKKDALDFIVEKVLEK